MSTWTHVTASFNLDTLPLGFSIFNCMSYLERILGDDIPVGSEGPLKFKVWDIDKANSANNIYASMWGNLRDYNEKDVKEGLIPYFENVYKSLWYSNPEEAKTRPILIVRGVSILIQVEYGKSWIMVASNPENLIVQEVELKDAS